MLMNALLLLAPILLLIMVFPISIFYLLLGYLVLVGWGSFEIVAALKIKVGSIGIVPLDILFVALLLSLSTFMLRRMFGGRRVARRIETKVAISIMVFYIALHLLRTGMGFFDGVPKDALVRMSYDNLQCLYFFLPLLFLKSDRQTSNLLRAVVVLSLIFPFGQLFLSETATTQFILEGQDTLRLGFGDANLLLAMGFIAILTWERWIYLAFIPAAGIMMLAHRSAFLAIALALVSTALINGKQLKLIVVSGFVGVVMVGALFVVQNTTSLPVFDKGLERVGQTFETTGTTSARVSSISQLLSVWLEKPVMGLGYRELYDLRSRADTSARAFNILHSHNFVLTSLVHTGLMGSIPLFAICGYSLLTALRLARRPGMRQAGAFLFSSMLFFLVFALMNTALSSAGYLFWILSGTTYWLLDFDRQKARLNETLGLHTGARPLRTDPALSR